jgi:hypothetical protein
MRAMRPDERVQVEAVVGDQVVFSKFERVVRPAEMIALTIPRGKVSSGVAAFGSETRLIVRVRPRDCDAGPKGGAKA